MNTVNKIIPANTISKIILPVFISAARGTVIGSDYAEDLRSFVQNKINNGTLYTPPELFDYPLSNRLQLFLNSNIAEHAVVDTLNGKLLESNDELTLESTAVLGPDGCALADVTVDGIEVEVKVVFKDPKKALKKAHKKPVVAVYIISAFPHWKFYVARNSPDLNDTVFVWEQMMNTNCPELSLLQLKDLADGSLAISTITNC